MIRTLIAAALLALSSAASARDGHTSGAVIDPASERVGTEFMVFETGVTGEAHEQFLRGLALLHNFEYSRAAAAFRKAQAADPDWVMPYWGEAMTHNHPLWEYQDRSAALAALAKLAPTPDERFFKSRSGKEAVWLSAVEALYGPEGTKEERDFDYLRVMQAFLAREPDDVDIRAFTGLAVLGVSHGGRDIALYMEAAGVLEPGFMTHERHPGILHYLIHSYDDPVHATLGRRMAERYALVAPDAGHAQHMISHIYHALGEWEASEKANVLADAVVDRQRAVQGRAENFCGHYNEWLVYALVQQGKDASALVEGCRAQAVAEIASNPPQGRIGPYRSASSSYTTIALYAGTSGGAWAEPVDWPQQGYLKARFDMAYARLLQSRDDRRGAASALADMEQLHELILEALPKERPDETGLQAWNARILAQGMGIYLLASGDTENGIAALREAAQTEAAMPIVFGPPAVEKPSAELLGEELLKLGRYQEAAEAFRAALRFAPNRKLSNEGLAAAEAG
ncbi:MAG: tetratricopeptide repeat protein [Pseudomonadota bacterium]